VNAITMGGIVRDAGLTIDEFRKLLYTKLIQSSRDLLLTSSHCSYSGS
jgi:hypothetical protein